MIVQSRKRPSWPVLTAAERCCFQRSCIVRPGFILWISVSPIRKAAILSLLRCAFWGSNPSYVPTDNGSWDVMGCHGMSFDVMGQDSWVDCMIVIMHEPEFFGHPLGLPGCSRARPRRPGRDRLSPRPRPARPPAEVHRLPGRERLQHPRPERWRGCWGQRLPELELSWKSILKNPSKSSIWMVFSMKSTIQLLGYLHFRKPSTGQSSTWDHGHPTYLPPGRWTKPVRHYETIGLGDSCKMFTKEPGGTHMN